jgi:hypothetical protein
MYKIKFNFPFELFRSVRNAHVVCSIEQFWQLLFQFSLLLRETKINSAM